MDSPPRRQRRSNRRDDDDDDENRERSPGRSGSDEEGEKHRSFRPHLPSFLHHGDDPDSESGSGSKKRVVKVYCKAEPDFALTIKNGKVLLAPFDPDDDSQLWYKDETFSKKAKDEEGHPSFALVNKATGQAMKHSDGSSHPVKLKRFDADDMDESVLWSQSKEIKDGYKSIRMVNNIHLNVDAYLGEKSDEVHEGTRIMLWEWNEGDNQLWQIAPHRH